MAKKKKQQEEKLPEITQKEFPKVIDIESIGNPSGDPCFGTKYDLTTDECKMCGDSELCCIKMSQALKVTRKELEAKNHYKDLETLEDVNGIKKYIRGLKRKGKTRKEIVEKASVKFEVPKKDIRLIYKSM